MKKCILLVLAISLIFPFPIFAEEELPRASSEAVTPKRDALQLLKQSSPSATEQTVSSLVSERVDLLLRLMNASVTRLSHISDRTSQRVEKIGKSGGKTSQLRTKYLALTQQLESTKKEVKKTEELSVTFLKDSSSLNTYQTFRKQLVSTVGKLTNILKSEKDLLADMKQYEVSTPGVATPTGKLKSL